MLLESAGGDVNTSTSHSVCLSYLSDVSSLAFLLTLSVDGTITAGADQLAKKKCHTYSMLQAREKQNIHNATI